MERIVSNALDGSVGIETKAEPLSTLGITAPPGYAVAEKAQPQRVARVVANALND